jgi:uncharacterized protein DUF4259
MGTWDFGPFDNDTAADFVADIDEASGREQLVKLRAALVAVEGSVDRIDAPDVEVAVAAAALVARDLEGGEEFKSSNYGRVRKLPSIPNDVILLAHDAVARIISSENDVKDYWDSIGDTGKWHSMLQRLRMVLSSDDSSTTGALW